MRGAGKIDFGLLPDLNVSQVFPNVPDEASMLALSAGLGDIAIRTDLSDVAFICISIPSTVIGNWRQLNSTAAVTSVNGKIGAVTLDTGDISENGNLYYTDERVDDRVSSLLVAGNNVSLPYDDVVGSITISANDTSVAFSEITDKPTTLSGYGISDAYTKTQIDSNKQPLDATLTAIAGVSTSADKIIYFTGTDTAAATTLSSFGRTLIDDANASTALITLGAQSQAPNYTGVKSSNLASASTVNIGAATGDYIHITGTTTITSFGTIAAGVERTLVFDGALTLTHNATSLILHLS